MKKSDKQKKADKAFIDKIKTLQIGGTSSGGGCPVCGKTGTHQHKAHISVAMCTTPIYPEKTKHDGSGEMTVTE